LKSDPDKKALAVAVLGATGYAGVELLRILARHPRIQLTAATSQQYAGKRVSEIYPSLAGKCELVLEELAPAKVRSCSSTSSHLPASDG